MRMTLTIVGHVLAVAQALAARMSTSLGNALSELARRGFRGTSIAQIDRDPTVFAVAEDAEPFTSEDVYRSLDEWL